MHCGLDPTDMRSVPKSARHRERPSPRASVPAPRPAPGPARQASGGPARHSGRDPRTPTQREAGELGRSMWAHDAFHASGPGAARVSIQSAARRSPRGGSASRITLNGPRVGAGVCARWSGESLLFCVSYTRLAGNGAGAGMVFWAVPVADLPRGGVGMSHGAGRSVGDARRRPELSASH